MTAKQDALVRGPGRPRELTAREIEEIERLVSVGVTVAAIARALRRPWSTVRAAIARMEAHKHENPAALTGAPGDVNPEGGLHVQSDDTTLPDAEGNGTSEEV